MRAEQHLQNAHAVIHFDPTHRPSGWVEYQNRQVRDGREAHSHKLQQRVRHDCREARRALSSCHVHCWATKAGERGVLRTSWPAAA